MLVNASQYAHTHIDLGKPNNFQNVIRWLPVVATIAMAIAVIFIFKKQKTNSERNKNSLETLEMISSLYLSM